MKQIKKYSVLPGDRFEADRFSTVNDEIASIRKQVESLPTYYKADIIISFAKDHSLRNDWIKANPDLTELVCSGLLLNGNIEALFQSCSANQLFRKDFEDHLRERFN